MAASRRDQIASDLRGQIARGAYPVGRQLPGINELQRIYGGAALETVRAAQRILVAEGLLRVEPHVGALVIAAQSAAQDALAALSQDLANIRQLVDQASARLSAITEDRDNHPD